MNYTKINYNPIYISRRTIEWGCQRGRYKHFCIFYVGWPLPLVTAYDMKYLTSRRWPCWRQSWSRIASWARLRSRQLISSNTRWVSYTNLLSLYTSSSDRSRLFSCYIWYSVNICSCFEVICFIFSQFHRRLSLRCYQLYLFRQLSLFTFSLFPCFSLLL